MRYWWVNQNQTYKYEVPGGFMWSPFKNANGARNPFYDNMDKVQPGDLVFAYAQQQVKAIGVAQKRAYSAPKPASFENASNMFQPCSHNASTMHRKQFKNESKTLRTCLNK